MQKYLNFVKNNSWNTINNKSFDLRVNVFFLTSSRQLSSYLPVPFSNSAVTEILRCTL